MGIGVSIVGSGHTKFGRLQENLEQLIVAASQEALQEAGITGNEVDAVFLGHSMLAWRRMLLRHR